MIDRPSAAPCRNGPQEPREDESGRARTLQQHPRRSKRPGVLRCKPVLLVLHLDAAVQHAGVQPLLSPSTHERRRQRATAANNEERKTMGKSTRNAPASAASTSAAWRVPGTPVLGLSAQSAGCLPHPPHFPAPPRPPLPFDTPVQSPSLPPAVTAIVDSSSRLEFSHSLSFALLQHARCLTLALIHPRPFLTSQSLPEPQQTSWARLKTPSRLKILSCGRLSTLWAAVPFAPLVASPGRPTRISQRPPSRMRYYGRQRSSSQVR